VTVPNPALTDWVPLWNLAAPGVVSQPGARVYRTTNQTIPNVTSTAILFDAERFDTENIHDTATNTDRLTCRTPGKYLIIGQVEWAVVTAGERLVWIESNGSVAQGRVRALAGGNTTQPTQIASTILDLQVGDYVRLLVYQDSGAGLNVTAAPNFAPEFMMVLLGGLPGPPGPGTAVYGTSLPTTPYDGQEAVLVDSLTNPTYIWRFRYNANSTSTYKWEFVGGTHWLNEIDGQDSLTNTASYADLATVGPSLTLPRAGDYILDYGHDSVIGAANSLVYASPYLGTAAVDADYCAVGTTTAGTSASSAARRRRVTFASPNTLVKLQYKLGAAGTGYTRKRWLSATPVRVS